MNPQNIVAPVERRIGRSFIRIFYGDITTVSADVLVSSDDTRLSMSGGVSQALRTTAGEEIYEEIEAKRSVPLILGEVVSTNAGRLSAKALFHTAVLDWEHPKLTTKDLIRRIVHTCLRLCDERRYRTIAFPALATGTASLSPEYSAIAMIVEIADYLRHETNIESVSVALWAGSDKASGVVDRFYSLAQQYLEVIEAVYDLQDRQKGSNSSVLGLAESVVSDVLLTDPRQTGVRWGTRATERKIARVQDEKLKSVWEKVQRRPLVFSVHGIRTRGKWQKEITPILNEAGFDHVPYDYGDFGILPLLLPWTRDREIDRFRDEYPRKSKENQLAPSVIAHSFGSYVVARAITKYNLKFNKIIFCGGIVPEDYDWATVIREGYGDRILNDCGYMDIWSKIAPWAISDAGQSGLRGFKNTAGGRVINRQRKGFRHSDYFYEDNYVKGWLPFLKGETPQEPINPVPPTVNWRFRITIIVAALVLLILIAYVSIIY